MAAKITNKHIILSIASFFIFISSSLAHSKEENNNPAQNEQYWKHGASQLGDKNITEWYQYSAEKGHAYAQYKLGIIYFVRNGSAQDHKQAVAWLRKAALQGHSLAQSWLGKLYERGLGIAQDRVQAAAWYSVSAINGNVSASVYRDMVAKNMTTAEFAKAKLLAFEYSKYINKN